MIDRLTCCVEPKRSLEAGALCVEVLVLLTVIRGTEVVLVPRTFECSLHGVHTLQCLKIEMGPSLVLQTYRCLGFCVCVPLGNTGTGLQSRLRQFCFIFGLGFLPC